jgi:hypothetical protein
MLEGIVVGGLAKVIKYGFDVGSQFLTEKKELKQTEQNHQFEIEKIRLLKEQDISIEEYKSLTAKSETEKSSNETERMWIETVGKLQTVQVEYLPYFKVHGNKWYEFFIGIGNLFILFANLGIAGANVFKNLQKECITLLIGYATLFVMRECATEVQKIASGMIYLFETIVSYNFLDKNLSLKKKS